MPLLKNNANIYGITIDQVEFSSVTQGEGNSILNVGHIQTISFTNATFTNVTSFDEGDETSGILLISTLDLNSQFNIGINNIHISNSSTNFISYGSIVNTPPTIKHIEISNFTYTDSYIRTDRKLLSTDGIEVGQNLLLILRLITFNNISYYNTGSLISFGHQIFDHAQVTGLVCVKITSGKVYLKSTNQQNTDLLTRVHISNSIFDNVDNQYSSLIITEQGGRLNVTNSSFTNIYTFGEGAVVSAGATATEVNFHDVMFSNNSAVSGALFHIETESLVR